MDNMVGRLMSFLQPSRHSQSQWYAMGCGNKLVSTGMCFIVSARPRQEALIELAIASDPSYESVDATRAAIEATPMTRSVVLSKDAIEVAEDIPYNQ